MTKPGALAIVHQDHKILLQLRDDIPTIWYPHKWSLWGGGIEEGETPEHAVLRELKEELDWDNPEPVLFSVKRWHDVPVHIFTCKLNIPLHSLHVLEGETMKLMTVDEALAANTIPHHKEWIKEWAATFK